ncbi:MAG: hypothetical protein R6X25_01670 [Candidatus Krumholzibacteriia bacterium]
MDRHWRPVRRAELLLAGALAVLLLVAGWCSLGSVRAHTREAAVCRNARTLQLAAEVHAARYGGVYPTDPVDLVALLPEGRSPRNPYTGALSIFDGSPGDLAYAWTRPGLDYRITAYAPGNAGPRPLLVLTGSAPRR